MADHYQEHTAISYTAKGISYMYIHIKKFFYWCLVDLQRHVSLRDTVW